MSHESIIASAVVTAMGLLVVFALPIPSQEKAEAVLEAVAGQASRSVGGTLKLKDVGVVVTTYGCSAYFLSRAMEAYHQGRYPEALELDQHRLRCFRAS